MLVSRGSFDGQAVSPAAQDAPVSFVPLELCVFVHGEVRVHPLPAEGEVVVGRAEECHVRVDHPSVSRRHALLVRGPGLSVRDLGGANGTFVRDRSEPENLLQTRTMRRLGPDPWELSVGESVLLGEVTAVVRRAAQSPSAFGDLAAAPRSTPGVVIGDSAMRAVYAQAELAAQSSISVLILGETGVGKDLLARAIHGRSKRAAGPFLSINCAALSESLLESEIFGYERGAFTGAVTARPGLFESADQGTVFLDELGELPLATQAKLLRVLEERSVLRIGARAPRNIDVRFLAATNRDLEADAAAGRFRADLYFRVAGLCLTIPPLRERPSEIEPLIFAFLRAATKQLDRNEPSGVAPEALDLLRGYAWPGNVRELKNVIERAAILCTERDVALDHLPPKLRQSAASARGEVQALHAGPAQAPTPAAAAPAGAGLGPARDFQAELKAFERQRLVEVLGLCAGNQTRAAKMLGISRRTLVSRLTEFGLTRPRRRAPG
jgi:two-component system response regulator AtoC